jgi:hypothetical protein
MLFSVVWGCSYDAIYAKRWAWLQHVADQNVMDYSLLGDSTTSAFPKSNVSARLPFLDFTARLGPAGMGMRRP